MAMIRKQDALDYHSQGRRGKTGTSLDKRTSGDGHDSLQNNAICDTGL